MSSDQPRLTQQQLKEAAAAYAIDTFIASSMYVGLGSGSTAEIFVQQLAQRARSGEFKNLVTVATSDKIEEMTKKGGLKVVHLNDVSSIDLTVDGADEIVPATFALTKGRGGALLREKMVAGASRLEVIISDDSKLVNRLGEKMPVPVEVISFGWHHTAARLRTLGCDPVLRLLNEQPYLSDSGNYIIDCHFPPLDDPLAIAIAIKTITGVVEHGLFIGIAGRIVIAGSDRVYEVTTPANI